MVGTVGLPLAVASLRLESVPEMNYDALADPPKGEVLVKGKANFCGYYKDKKKTNEVLDEDGWFHTGGSGPQDWQENVVQAFAVIIVVNNFVNKNVTYILRSEGGSLHSL